MSLLVCMNPRETTLYTRDSNESHFARKQSPLSFFHGQTLICLSHLRWDFVFQRPQHLMTRFAQVMPVFFIEEPIIEKTERSWLQLRPISDNLTVGVPHIPESLDKTSVIAAQRSLLKTLCAERNIGNPVLWFYTPMAVSFADDIRAAVVVYDCMDELAAFKDAPPELAELEHTLLERADLVFTGGFSLYEAKRNRHPSVHAFPSAVDVAHFAAARGGLPDPVDQAGIPHPRLGFFGVIDERMDTALLTSVARRRPDWHFIMIGPVVKIDPAILPHADNIHYLGGKHYQDLPDYAANWDAALMPFALNEATRFISPTKTAEYLAAGRPVISTSIVDVVRQWGHLIAVSIADTPEQFVSRSAVAVKMSAEPGPWLEMVDRELADLSWDQTWEHMMRLIEAAGGDRRLPHSGIARPAPFRSVVPSAPVSPLRQSGFDYLIVGAGLAGSVLAERLATASHQRVLVVDRRSHIGGNTYDCYNDDGILVQRYGPHIFHTNSKQVVDYLSRFTAWRPYEHRVRAAVGNMTLPIPINRTTINRLFQLTLSEAEIADFLKKRAEPVARIKTAEDLVLAQVGSELYETFFRGYTRKQWGLDPSELDKSVTARIPVRINDDDRYFTDTFQMMPRFGFTRLFENMLDSPNIKIMLNVDYREVMDEIAYDRMIYTGPIDEFFEYRYGKLPYRSLRFQHETLNQEQFQPVATINYPSEKVPFTRVTEYKHLTGQVHPKTAITYEFPTAEGDPYYPVPRADNAELYLRYRQLADAAHDIEFVGRLATYRYYNMDQVVAQALSTYARISAAGPRKIKTAAREPAAALS